MKLQEQDVFAGRYRLLRRIGSGGFSVVWLAADQMTNDRQVALKIYVPDKGMDRQGIKMFVREYEIVADMNHPGLLKATHFDVHDGSPFLVMPFCSAGSLHSRMMERGAISEGEIAEVLEQTAGALAYLHREEVVHQDIKPDNVLINDRGEYLLTDFGISSRMRSTMRKSTGRKDSMTVAYAPPERFGGKSEVLPAGDMFSLGVMIYELATGEVPWMAAGGAMLHPDSVPLELPEGYSRELELLMQACVSYSPADRPTAEEVKAAARSYLSTGRWGAVSGRKRKGGGLWWLWVLVALVVLGGGYGVYTMMESGMGSVPEPGPVVVDSASVEGDTVDNDSDEFREADGYDETDEDEQAAETSAWASAERSDTKAGYEGYLEDYPDGAHAGQAEMKLDEIAEEERMDRERRAEASAWAAAERSDTKAGYEGYLEDYPDGAHAGQAEMKLDEIAEEERKDRERRAAETSAWAAAERSDTKAGYEGYLEDYPDGAHAGEARSKINDIEARARAEAERRRAASKSPAEKAAEEIASTMVNISGGSFRMGCTSEQGDDCDDDERPAHKVYVPGFQLNKYEVTQGQWRAIMGDDPEDLYNPGCDRCPVEGVSWNDAQEFIRKLNRISGENYRLPTEAEWEYAARGGQQSRGYKYSGSDRIDAVTWYKGNAKAGNNHGSKGTTRPVGGKRANELGLYDMSGNVWEWCSDWFADDYYEESPRNNPGGPSSGSDRVLRGGSWYGSARFCRVSNRRDGPGFRYNNYGFRLAR